MSASPQTRVAQRRRILRALAMIPFFDCIVDQLNNALHLTVGPLSLLQLVHGSLMVIFVVLCFRSAFLNASRMAKIPIPAIGAFLLIGIASSKELIVTGTLSMASIGPYGQMAYWIIFWITVSMLCESREDTEILLRGLAVGALATAASVFAGLVFGAPNYYTEDAVVSSAGWFDTGKMITGVLNTGGVVLLYLGRGKRGWLYPVLACSCFAACIVTYARAGSVALGAIVLWLPVWSVFFARSGNRRWVGRFFALILMGLLLVPFVTDTGKLFARWADVGQGKQAGSGRATFWKIALDGYVAATPARQALGRGYAAMADMLRIEYGMDIKHTHNDLLDMLTVFGLVGALWLALFVGTLLWRVARSSPRTIEGAAGAAILLNYLLHSQFTGQIWGTDAMSYYTVSLTCLYVSACADRAMLDALPVRRPYRTVELVIA